MDRDTGADARRPEQVRQLPSFGLGELTGAHALHPVECLALSRPMLLVPSPHDGDAFIEETHDARVACDLAEEPPRDPRLTPQVSMQAGGVLLGIGRHVATLQGKRLEYSVNWNTA